MHVAPNKLVMLQEGVSTRQQELEHTAGLLASAAHQYQRLAATIRLLLIICGALATTQAAWEQAITGYKEHGFVIFTLLGVCITILAGIEAAFKFETKGAELNLLAASCHSMVRRSDASWYKLVGVASSEEDKVSGALALIELQDNKLSEIQEKAANAGVNITKKKQLRVLWDDDDNHAENITPPERSDYPA